MPTDQYIRSDMADENIEIAICLDCFTWRPFEEAIQKDSMLWQTETSSCKFCGGKVVKSRQSEVESIKRTRRQGKLRQ